MITPQNEILEQAPRRRRLALLAAFRRTPGECVVHARRAIDEKHDVCTLARLLDRAAQPMQTADAENERHDRDHARRAQRPLNGEGQRIGLDAVDRRIVLGTLRRKEERQQRQRQQEKHRGCGERQVHRAPLSCRASTLASSLSSVAGIPVSA
jgi:hypothetical protein